MQGKVIWITGLSGAGKSTLADELAELLRLEGTNPIRLDGDILRDIFNTTASEGKFYKRTSRLELALKYSYLCLMLANQGFTVVISTISMFEEVYKWNRENLKNYLEVYLKAPLEILRSRDPKNLYRDYFSGRITNVAGLDLDVDAPKASDLVIDVSSGIRVRESALKVMKVIAENPGASNVGK